MCRRLRCVRRRARVCGVGERDRPMLVARGAVGDEPARLELRVRPANAVTTLDLFEKWKSD